MATQRRPGIPSIDPNLPQGLQNVLQPLKENVEISLGLRSSGQQVGSGVGYPGWQLRSVTLGMLVQLGVITEAQALAIWQSP